MDNTYQSFNAISNLVKFAKDYGHRKIKDAGYSDTEHHICTFLFFHDGVSQDTVADTLMMDKTTVAKALSSLETKGHIVKNANAENRRKNDLHLTDGGRLTVSDFVGIYDEWTSKVTDCLSESEKKQFFNMCENLCLRAKQINEELK